MAFVGRELPEPELLQPRLDPGLPPYRPCRADTIRGRLEGSAPAIMARLVGRWLLAFHQIYPLAQVRVPPPYGAPQGALSPPLQRFLQGQSDFAFVSRDPSDTDQATFARSHGHPPLVVPVVAGAYRHFGFLDAMALIVHRDNPIQNLSFAQIDAVFSKSRLRGHPRVQTWGDLGLAAWADKPVQVVGAVAWNDEASARAASLRDKDSSVCSQRGLWRVDLPSVGSEADVPGQVAADRYAIGFTGMGHLLDGVKTLAVSDDADPRFYEPSYEFIASAKYPLARVANLMIANPPGTALDPTLREFTRFLLSREGQQIVLDQGVMLPLRAHQVERALRLLQAGGGSLSC